MDAPIPIYTGPIAVLDMLGFKKFVEKQQIKAVIDAYAHVITSVSFTSDVLNEDLQIMVYSDTIAIRLVNHTEPGFFNFIKAIHMISSLFYYQCQIPGSDPIPIRGAIAYGEYSWHNGDISTQVFNRDKITARNINFVVGQAIIDAHVHEIDQQWIGVSMTEATAIRIERYFPEAFNRLRYDKYLIQYEIPGKSTNQKGYVINPTIRATFKSSFEGYVNKCEEVFNDGDLNKEVKLKYYNTMIFLNYLHENDCLIPYFNDGTEEERSAHQVVMEKERYSLVKSKFA